MSSRNDARPTYRWLRRRALAAALVAGWCAACGGETTGEVQIGKMEADDTFRPFAEGEGVDVYLGGGDLEMLQVSLRAQDISWDGADTAIEAAINGRSITDLVQQRDVVVCDPDGCVLRQKVLAFTVPTCCFQCAPATIIARSVDGRGHRFEGTVTVTLQHEGADCSPDLICCALASACPEELADVAHICP